MEWRIERANSILVGSFSDDDEIAAKTQQLLGSVVEDVSLFARLPEVCVALSGGYWLSSFQTTGGDPAWSIMTKNMHGAKQTSVFVKDGVLAIEHADSAK